LGDVLLRDIRREETPCLGALSDADLNIVFNLPGFKVIILHVVHEPEEDYFPTSTQKEKWLTQHMLRMDALLEDYRQLLIKKGFDPKDVAVHSMLRYCPSMAACILSESDKTEYSTIVMGRQGLS
jgi:hypothetical protein